VAAEESAARSPSPGAGDTRSLPSESSTAAGADRPAYVAPGGPGTATAPRGSRFRSRRTWLIAAAALVAVLVVGGIGFGIGWHSGHGFGGHRGHHGGPGHSAMERGGFGMGPGGRGGPDGGGPGGFGGGAAGLGGPGMGPEDGPGMGPEGGPGGGRRGGFANTAALTGAVVSVAPDSLVVAPDGGAPQVTVPTNDRTRVRGAGNGLTGLQPGQRVVVLVGGDKSAAAVFSPPARAVGTVTALNGDRAVLVRPDGLTVGVDLAAANPKPANGDVVAVSGTAADNGATIKVTTLRVLPKAS
jgi:hypothetical protein